MYLAASLGFLTNRVLRWLEIAATNTPITTASGNLGEGNTSAPFQTITTAKISLTYIDYPPMPISTTFALVPPTGQPGVVPTALAPSDVRLFSFDNQANVEERSAVSAFIPETALSQGRCRGASANTSCTRRVLFLVYTSLLFFQQVQDTPPTMTETSTSESVPPTTSSSTTGNVMLANSLILSISLGAESRVQLPEPVSMTFTPLSGRVSEVPENKPDFFRRSSSVWKLNKTKVYQKTQLGDKGWGNGC